MVVVEVASEDIVKGRSIDRPLAESQGELEMKNWKKLDRREALILGGKVITLGSALAVGGSLFSCGSELTTNIGASAGVDTSTGGGGSCASAIPSETEGPYPAHDDSAKNCLRFSGIVRQDITSSLNTGGYYGTSVADGIPLRITLTLSSAGSCSPLSGYALYLWHCDSTGGYSMYSSGVSSETYLRGVQQSDANGQVVFDTIFPGCYDGRVPHMHFEVFQSLSSAVDDAYVLKTSQLTFDRSVCQTVYSDSRYGSSSSNLSRIDFASDGIFSDGYSTQLASLSGSNSSGYEASLLVGL